MRTATVFVIAALIYWTASVAFESSWAPQIQTFLTSVDSVASEIPLKVDTRVKTLVPPTLNIGFAMMVSTALGMIPWGVFFSLTSRSHGAHIAFAFFVGVVALLTAVPAVLEPGGRTYGGSWLVSSIMGGFAGYYIGILGAERVRAARDS